MNEQLIQQPEIKLEVVKATFNLELTQNKFQEIQTAVDELVYNEDNIPEIKEILEKVKKLKKVIDVAHESGKKYYLETGRMFDTAKKDMYAVIDGILEPAAAKYTKLCKDKQDREAAEAAEAARKKQIRDGIQGNILAFSQKIASATTSEQLIGIERFINLEKANKAKYGEFLEEAVAQYTQLLNEPLKAQKENIRQLEDVAAKKAEAEAKGDDSTFLELHEKEAQLETKIEEAKMVTQENAIASATAPTLSSYTTVSSPAVKPDRQSWKFEVKDINVAYKKMPQWVELIPNNEVIKSYLNGKKVEGIPNGTKEFEVAGIRFYLEEKFI